MVTENSYLHQRKWQALFLVAAIVLLLVTGYVTYLTGFFAVSTAEDPIPVRPSNCTIPASELATNTVADVEPGCFDFYTYTLVWPSEQCLLQKEASATEQRDGMCNPYGYFHNKLVPLSLTPTIHSSPTEQVRYPVNCKTIYSGKLVGAIDFTDLDSNLTTLAKEANGLAFATKLQKLWEKTGSCSGYSPQVYFALVYNKLYQKLAQFPELAENSGKTISSQAIEEHFQGLGAIARCRKVKQRQYLIAIDLFLNKQELHLTKELPQGLEFDDRCDPDQPILVRSIDSLYKK